MDVDDYVIGHEHIPKYRFNVVITGDRVGGGDGQQPDECG